MARKEKRVPGKHGEHQHLREGRGATARHRATPSHSALSVANQQLQPLPICVDEFNKQTAFLC